MSYKIYINKHYKPVIRRVVENRFFSNSVVNKILALVLCVTTGLILGMRSPEFPIVQDDFKFEPRFSTEPGSLVSPRAVTQTAFPTADTGINPAPEEKVLRPKMHSATETSPPNSNKVHDTGNENSADWETFIVQSGDNLSVIFDRLQISRQDLDRIMSLGKDTTALKNLMPGHALHLRYTDEQLDALEYEINLTDTIRVGRHDAAFSAETVTLELETQTRQASGVITDSLFLSAQRSGLSDNLIMQLIELYGWDIDFALDIREGDRFYILYEEKYRNGVKVQDGPIQAAKFINQNRPFYALRYTHADGYSSYYDENGFSMRKDFLRTPVNFTRISSGFSLARRHPILNRIRAHKGVDYAAPSGTPVKATGDGIVDFAGTSGGYGKMIVLRHGEKYSTVYGHLSRFSKNIARGKNIKQGQTIGYVGITGLATGPHLHYEFRINGVHYNPLTIKLPKALEISKDEMPTFRAQTHPLLAQLESTKTASANQPLETKPALALIKNPEEIRAIE